MTERATIRSLLPREHGAYGQLALPLLAALSCGRPSMAAAFYALVAVLAFLAHEPLLVLCGHRGPRALREVGARARTRLLLYSVLVLLALGLALVFSTAMARLAFLGPLAGAGLVGFAIASRRERTDWGETVAALALSASSLPVAISGGVPPTLALLCWAVWTVGFGLFTITLRRAIHGRKTVLPGASDSPLLPALVFCAGALLFLHYAAFAFAVLPMATVSLVLFIAPPAPRRLSQVGWLLVGSSALTGLLLVLAVRGAVA